jgi:hypothetical protein
MDTVHPKMQMNLLKDKNNINGINADPQKCMSSEQFGQMPSCPCSECFWKHKTSWGARLSIGANIWMPSRPIDYLLSPKVTPLLTGHNLKTVSKYSKHRLKKESKYRPVIKQVILEISEPNF